MNDKENSMKKIKFQGREISTEEARKIIQELETALVISDPVTERYPDGKKIPLVINPQWYIQPAPLSEGAILTGCAEILPVQGEDE